MEDKQQNTNIQKTLKKWKTNNKIQTNKQK
jgi:hypothetical protein